MKDKNQIIREAISATRSKRKSQVCKSFRFKVDRSSLSATQRDALKMFFIETKRLYNYILSQNQNGIPIPESTDYKRYNTITYLDRNRNEIEYNIQYIGSSIISDTIRLIQDSIKSLSSSKKKGNKIGRLTFKTECNSIRLRQYGVTHKIKGSRIKIQGIKKPIRVNGLRQLEKYKDIDYTVANLLYDGYDYYVSLTCYVPKEIKVHNNKEIGIDFGCETTITTSEGDKIKIRIGESERLKRLQAKLNRQQKRSNNWYKTRSLINKEYNHITNQKRDAANKLIHYLTSYKTVVIQDDPISEWHQDKHCSRTVQHSSIGYIKSRLKKLDNVFVLDQWVPTTQHCFVCGTDTVHDVTKRTFTCPVCGTTSDRDVHAANNMIMFYKLKTSPSGTDGHACGATNCEARSLSCL